MGAVRIRCRDVPRNNAHVAADGGFMPITASYRHRNLPLPPPTTREPGAPVCEVIDLEEATTDLWRKPSGSPSHHAPANSRSLHARGFVHMPVPTQVRVAVASKSAQTKPIITPSPLSLTPPYAVPKRRSLLVGPWFWVMVGIAAAAVGAFLWVDVRLSPFSNM